MSRKRLFQVAVCCFLGITALGASRGAITKLTLNPEAPVVDLFEGKEQGQFDVRLVAMNAHEGRIFITNKTDKPLSVSVPAGLVGVQVHPQILNQQPGGVGNFFGNGQQNQQQGQQQNQSVGGNAGPMNGNATGFPNQNGIQNGFPNGQNQGNGLNFFSIPPEKTVQLAFHSVCLNYGRREPNAALKYELVKADSLTTDPVLLQLLEDYSPRTNREAQQAAAWHVANGLSWDKIAQLKDEKVPGDPRPLFTAQQIQAGRTLAEQAQKKAADRPKKVDAVRSVVAK
ncbi:MAG: hypothetical protein WCJ09_19610 [Planctomycetota bacterium]